MTESDATSKHAPAEITKTAGHVPAGLLIDLDGTVLSASDRPSASVIRAVHAASLLIPVGIASGRVQDDVCHYARLFGLTAPQVAENGATLIDPVTGRAIKRQTLDRTEAEKILAALRRVSRRLMASGAGRFIRDPDEVTDWEITLIMAEFSTRAEASDWANRLNSSSITASISLDNKNSWYLDCTKAGADKASGARDFAEHVGIRVADLMVIGDGMNDIPMFRVAGIPVAMDGAEDELLELAVDVVPSVEQDGAATAIEKYILSRSWPATLAGRSEPDRRRAAFSDLQVTSASAWTSSSSTNWGPLSTSPV
ncbi:MAG: HAD family hydrolase [Chloroflexi bacterium]|nr:HAD family hydrolase [Chloroflexota bacterium]